MSMRLNTADRELQAKARAFTDELIPWEVEAEMNDGVLPPGVADGQAARAKELGLLSLNFPVEMGGPGYSMLQQVLIQEQTGRVSNALAWVVTTGPAWIRDVVTEHQMQRWIAPT
ncbi:MAG: acyl-CoA dehydrogenase, partial [Actinobacteria bacterium]